jgi:hypothetical protein
MLTISARLKQRSRENRGGIVCGPLFGPKGTASRKSRGSRCGADACLLHEDSLQPRRGKVQESAYFDRQKPVGGIHEIHRQ